MSEETTMMIMGLYIYRIITPSRFACSLMPSGAVGMLEGLTISNNVQASTESPATLLFVKPVAAKQIEWSSEKKCFIYKADSLTPYIVI